MLRTLTIAAGSFLLSSVLVSAQESFVTGADFAQATGEAKLSTLKRLVVRDAPIEPTALAETLRAGAGDANPAIRSAAMAVLASRGLMVQMTRGGPSDTAKRGWLQERPELLKLRPTVEALLADSVPDVRFQAVSALQALDFDGGGVYGKRLTVETVRTLARHYAGEQTVRVRRAVVSVLGGAAATVPEAQKVLSQATTDAAAEVRQVALLGLMEAGPATGLPAVTRALVDPDPMVRKQAAALVLRAGPAAKPYVADIERALRRADADATTRQNLATALERLR